MKQTLVDSLIRFANNNHNLYLMTGDLGYPHLTKFAKLFPKQYLNMGIAEQNMISVSAGLALSGKIVFIYSIIPFATMRCFEQIRNDLCYHKLNVKIVGFGTGLSYATHGITHFGTEDVAVIRSLPNMTILSPANIVETTQCLKIAYRHPGPVYIRLGKGQNDSIYPNKLTFHLGEGILVNDGRDVTIITTGTILNKAYEVTKILRKKNISTRLISMPSLKTIDKKNILASAKQTKIIVTLEEHSLIGGLGSIVSEILIDENINIRLVRLGLPDQYPEKVGSQEYMLEKAGLSVSQITNTIIKHIRSLAN